MNKAEAKREACSLAGTNILAAPADFIDAASREYDTDEDRDRVLGALFDLAHELIARGNRKSGREGRN